MASYHLGSMSPRDIAAYWNLVMQCIKKNQRQHCSRNQRQQQEMMHQLNSIFSRTITVVIARQDEFNSREIATFLRTAMAHHNQDHSNDDASRLFSSMEGNVMTKCFNRCSEKDLSNIAWAYAVANVGTTRHLFGNNNESTITATAAATTTMSAAFAQACIRLRHKFPIEGLSQLHQWQLWQRELKTNVVLASPSLKLKCYKAFITRMPRPSALQDSVISELSSIGLTPEVEVLTRSGYLLDAVVNVRGRDVAIEVDGPSHFVGKQPTIATILKRRQVASLEGMSVVSVPFWEWNKRRKDRGRRQQYLRYLLGIGGRE
ncbi:hypothetical protein ACHAXR_005784 [Thalassiosira sp. AJA248-18]